ncbi:hypothetical protein PENTCL1PPCAC_25972 [Pristionchus entomophagus]|uniref:Uncharacterized protein n=1 Tax=Pristionchus entomophagus TaxID=358040 RepID=A0AAV5UAV9_9BILA|nr:hypothetical protein PENTCL1PPCAC_25972 [Pristionchus entomophagus]
MSGDYVNVVAPAQPREWFAVLFGSRLLRGELRFVHKLTDAVKSICLDEGLPLTDRPSHRVIFEDVDVNVLVRDMRREVNRIQLKHYEGPHMPFVIVIDDQTLLELHEKYVEPNFSEDAWIYSLRGPRVKECVAVDAWDQIRLDIKDLKPLMDEYNPLPPLPVSRREPPLREKEFRPISNRHRDEGYSTRERQIDRYESEVRTRDYAPSPPITNGKAKITAVVVDGALINVEIHPSLIERLAEDMDANVDYANIKDIQQLPRTDTEVLSLLRLFVLSTENTLRNQNAAEREHGVQLRRKITETMLKSGLLKEVRDVFVGGLHDRLSRDDITDNDILKAASAIHLLFRAFIQLGNHDFVLHEDALSLWRQMETPVFTLPSRFWRVLSPDLIERLCDAAAEITTNNREVYIANVRVALEGLPSTDEHHAGPSTEGGDRRERIVDNGRPSVSPADRYDPYDWEDESDTSERYGTGEDGYDGRPRRDGRDGRDGHQENRRRQEEERRRREEEERIREAEELRELEEKAEREREFERIRHNQAMQQLEKKRWQEGNDLWLGLFAIVIVFVAVAVLCLS